MSCSPHASVSLCMIVRNEAHQLDDCLSPVAELFDQIVIVDTGSHDETSNVARRFTPHVFDFPWCDDFSAARNESLRHATGDWIFWLDADDRLDAENVDRLRWLLQNLSDQPGVYMLDTVCVPREAHDLEQLITHPRLFRRHPGLRFTGRVHEQLHPCPSLLGCEVAFADVQIRHIGYRDAALVQRKLHRDIRLLRMDYALDPSDLRTLLHLGTTYAQLGNAPEARRFLHQLLQAVKRPHDYLRRVFSTLGQLSLYEGKAQAALEILARGLSMFPDDDHLAYVQSEALYELDRYDAANRILRQIMDRPDSWQYHAGAPSGMKHLIAPRSLGEVLRIQRDFSGAEAVLRKVLDQFPLDVLTWHSLGRVYIDTANRQGLDEVLARLRNCPGGETFLTLLLAAWHMLRSEWKSAEKFIDKLIALSPQMPLARLMRAETLAHRGAALAACLQAYRDVLRVQPGNAQAASAVQRLEGALHRPVTVGPQDWCTSVTFGVSIPS